MLSSEGQQKLIMLEESAKAAGKGKWGPPEECALHVRDIKWTLENPRHFVDSHHGKPVDGLYFLYICGYISWLYIYMLCR